MLSLHGTPYDKRHTKPCRFFQKGTCPLSADRCDFAHVKIRIYPVKYSYDSYDSNLFRAGQYDQGEMTAPVSPIEIGAQTAAILFHIVSDWEYPSSEDIVTATQRIHALPLSPRSLTLPPVATTKVPHGQRVHPHEPMLLPPLSSRRPVSLAVPPTSVSSEDLAQLIFRNGYSSPASDAPSLSDGDSEPPSAAWEAPELSERWPCSPPAPSPVVYYNPTPGLFSPGVPFMHPAFGPQASLKQATRTELRRPSMSARKLKALKTKQCKFFKKDGHCPQGSLCTFIHDPSAIQGYPPTQEPLLDSAGPSTQPSSRLGSEIDEERERNIYPITWRVIGGGVMMGGQREVCKSFIDGNCPEGDDCSNAHPNDVVETDIDDIHDIHDIQIPIDTPSSPIATPRASDIPLEQTHVTKQLEMAATPVSELLPDISPIVLRRGCEPLSFLSVKEELPPRPFSTPPRLSSRKANSMEWSAF